jgi:dTDP-glucose pyrophosphorylase
MNLRLHAMCVAVDATLREAMEAIGEGSIEIALLVDGRGRLLGTVSDGDVRRAILGGAGLEDRVEPHATRTFTWVSADIDRSAVLELMQARAINQVPVLQDGVVVGIHVLREVITRDERDTVAVVMAGGRGTRLAPVTDRVPKPMVPVAGRPILERIVLHLVGSGIRDIFLSVGHMADVIQRHFGDGADYGCRISYLYEDPGRPLGTAGALGSLPREECRSTGPILVMNGDLVTLFDVGRMLAAHENARGLATIGVREYRHEVPYGVVTTDGERVLTLQEKPCQTWAVNAGVYLLDPSLIDRIAPGTPLAMPSLLNDCLRRTERVALHYLDGDWIDVGRLTDLVRARGEDR